MGRLTEFYQRFRHSTLFFSDVDFECPECGAEVDHRIEYCQECGRQLL